MAQFTPQEFLATYLAQNNIPALSPREQYIVLGRLQQVLDASAATGTEPTPQRLAVALAGSETIRDQTGINDSQSESLIAALIVSADDTVTYIEENGSVEPPVDPVDPDTPADFTLTTATDEITGTANDDTIEGVVASLSSENTLNVTDKIDGGEGNDTLKVELKSNFAGFTKDSGFLKNVETVELTNAGSIQRVFSAKEVSGVSEYVLKGDAVGVDLTDLAAVPASVTISGQKAGTSTLTFATDVTKGTADAITLKLDNVGTVKVGATTPEAAVTVTANGIETVTVNTTGSVVAALAGTDTQALNVTGDGSAKLTAIQAGVKTIDASAATGALDINTANAAAITSFAGGAGDDTIRAEVGDFAANAQIAGGTGQNKLVTKETGTVQYDMSGIQTIELANTGALTFSATKTSGLEKIVVSNDASSSGTFAGLGSGSLAVDVAAGKTNTYTLSADNSGSVTANVTVSSAASATATEASDDVLTFSKASDVTLNVAKFGIYNAVLTANAATSATFNIDGQLGASAELAAAKATSVTIKDTNADTADTLKLSTSELKSLAVTAAGDLTVAASSDLTKVETLTVNAGKAFTLDSTGNTLDAVNSLTLEGAGATSAVTLNSLGTTTLGYGITANASGLKGGLTVGTVNTGAGNAINLNVAGVTGNVSIASSSNIAVAASGSNNTGSVTVDAKSVTGSLVLGAITAKNITVDASAVLGTVTVGALTGDTITFNAGGALATVTATQATVGKSLTYTGAELAANGATIDVVGNDVNLFLKGGLQADAFTVTGFATTTAAQKITVAGDLGLGTDSLTFNLAAQTSAVAIEINVKDLKGVETVTVTGVDAAMTAANFTYTGGEGSDVINLSALTIAASTAGKVVIDLGASDGKADTVAFGSAAATNGSAFEIKNFEAKAGTDVITFKAGLLADEAGGTTTGSISASSINEFAKGGLNATVFTATDKVFYEVAGAGDVAAGKGTVAADVWAAIAGTSGANFSDAAVTSGKYIFIVDDGTDSFLWHFVSADATASANDISLIGIVRGVTDFDDGDLSVVA